MLENQIKGIVLAAGFGTRLRPITDSQPKPLIPILNTPLLQTILAKFADSGINEIAVNGHYHSDKLEAFLTKQQTGANTHYYYEAEILGTGGPIINAKKFLQDSHFLLHNGDILTDIDLTQLLEIHKESENIATMVLIDGPENKVNVSKTDDNSGTIHDILDKLGRTPKNCLKMTYAGITVFSPEIFNYLPTEPEFCSIITAILKALREHPNSIGAFTPKNFYWNDVGTIKKFYQAHEDLLLRPDCMNWQHAGFPYSRPTSSTFFGKNVNLSTPEDKLTGFNCFGDNSSSGKNSSFNNCIILNDTSASEPCHYDQEVISNNFVIHKDYQEIEKLKIMENRECRNYKINMLVEQGSDRRFYRMTDIGTGTSDVLMISYEGDPDFDRYVSYGKYYQALGLQTPQIFSSEKDELSVLMENLGDTRLYEHVLTRPEENYHDIYCCVIDELIRFQVEATANIPNYPDVVFRDFYYEYFRWESNYFREYFLEKVAGIKLTDTEFLDLPFHQLAEEVRKQPNWIIHRDFQSQNIMLFNDTIRFVDFQGTRLAPFTYDLMSLIKDPYVPLSQKLRQTLTRYYYDKAKEVCKAANFAPKIQELSFEEFNKYCILTSLQRNMQALGAYGFLSLAKGKRQYLDYVPQGKAYLLDGLKAYEALSDKEFSLQPLIDIIQALT